MRTFRFFILLLAVPSLLAGCRSSRTLTRTAVADSSHIMVAETVSTDSVSKLSQTFRIPVDTLAYIATLPAGIGAVKEQGEVTLGIFGDGKGGLNLNVKAQAKATVKRTERRTTATSNASAREEKPPAKSRRNTLLPWIIAAVALAVLAIKAKK